MWWLVVFWLVEVQEQSPQRLQCARWRKEKPALPPEPVASTGAAAAKGDPTQGNPAGTEEAGGGGRGGILKKPRIGQRKPRGGGAGAWGGKKARTDRRKSKGVGAGEKPPALKKSLSLKKSHPGRRKARGGGGAEKAPPLKKARSNKRKPKAGPKADAVKPRARKVQKKAAAGGAPRGGRAAKKEVKGGKKDVKGRKKKVKAVAACATPGADKGKRPARKRTRPCQENSGAEGEGKGASTGGKVKPPLKKRRPLGVVDRFPYNKRTVLFSSQSPLCFVQIPDIMDAGPALFQALGEEERAALASRLPAVDSCSEARLARCFQSPQLQQSARDFHKLLREGCFDHAIPGARRLMVEHYNRLKEESDLRMDQWLEGRPNLSSRRRSAGTRWEAELAAMKHQAAEAGLTLFGVPRKEEAAAPAGAPAVAASQ